MPTSIASNETEAPPQPPVSTPHEDTDSSRPPAINSPDDIVFSPAVPADPQEIPTPASAAIAPTPAALPEQKIAENTPPSPQESTTNDPPPATMAAAENPAPKPVETVPDLPVPAEESATTSVPQPANIPVEPLPEQLHTVVKGDTLTKIALKYQVSVGTIKKSNGLKSDVVRLGQQLKLPGGLAPAAKPVIVKAPAQPAGPLVHTVAKGDTLERIARKYHVEPREITQANDMKSDTVRLGRKLKIPSATPR